MIYSIFFMFVIYMNKILELIVLKTVKLEKYLRDKLIRK